MGHSIGDGIIVAALTVGLVGFLLLKYLERRQRLDILHAERLAAMDKGIPLPELPIQPPSTRAVRPPNPHVPLILGILLVAFGAGSMIALAMVDSLRASWPIPMPVTFMGGGLIIYYLLAGREREARPSTHRGD